MAAGSGGYCRPVHTATGARASVSGSGQLTRRRLTVSCTDQTWYVRGICGSSAHGSLKHIFIAHITNGPTGTLRPSNLAIRPNDALYLREYYKRREHTLCHQRGFDRSTWYSFNWLIANLIGYYEGAPPGTFYPAGTTHTVRRVIVSMEYSKSLTYV